MHAFCHVFFIVSVLLNFTYFVYIAIQLISWSSLSTSTTDNNHIPKTKISILVPARNEEAAISKCIDSILAQDYPSYLMEVIIADDHSTDTTKELAEKAFSQTKIAYKIVSNRENNFGKKSAITEAIQNSSGELLVITDADCRSKAQWLATIESEYQKSGAYMLCGPVQITGENGFLGMFQSLELCGLSLLSGAGINMNLPLLSNGANISYTRKMFDNLDGFDGINHTPSGDDILLMFKADKKYPGKISYIKSKDAIVSTSAQPSLKDFLSQRIRWASKGLSSKNIANSLASLLVFSANLFSLIAILFTAFHLKLFPWLTCGIIIKIMADFLLLLFATNFFGKKKLLWIFPMAEIFTMLYIAWVGIVANFVSYNWKGRQYKHPE